MMMLISMKCMMMEVVPSLTWRAAPPVMAVHSAYYGSTEPTMAVWYVCWQHCRAVDLTSPPLMDMTDVAVIATVTATRALCTDYECLQDVTAAACPLQVSPLWSCLG
jgi:hypothetical protein